MTRQKIFIRQIIYAVGIALLLYPLWVIGRPASVSSTGGLLAQIRNEAELTESQLGEIDPAGSTMKLATFGLRGVAIAMLWHQANEAQKKKNWSRVMLVADQLVLLEPHFTTIWEFMGWNLAYNASAEFDDYRDRYHWVIRGIDFLIRGTDFNKKAPKLFKNAGWTVSQKIGIADENEQYRRLLREDEDFGERHHCKSPEERDNWQLGRRWYLEGERLLIDEKKTIGNESDFLFCSHSRLNLFNYATWVRKDGVFGLKAIAAWDHAGEEWHKFSQMELSTAIPVDGSMKVLPGKETYRTTLEKKDLAIEKKKELVSALEALVPGLIEQLVLERWQELGEIRGKQGTLLDAIAKAEVRELKIVREYLDKNEPDWRDRLQKDLDTLYSSEELELAKFPPMILKEDQRDIMNKADSGVAQVRHESMDFLTLKPKLISARIQERDDVVNDIQQRARSIVQEIDGFDPDQLQLNPQLRMSDLYRGILNYEYRVREVAVERTDEVDQARKFRHEGRKAYYAGRMTGEDSAFSLWLLAMGKWEELLNKPGFEDIGTDGQFIREIIDIVEKFVIILDGVNQIFPENMPLRGLIQNKINQENNLDAALATLEYVKKEYADGKFELVEEHIQPVMQRFDSVNYAVEFMKLAPLPHIRDAKIEALALYMTSLEKQQKPLPEFIPLKTFVLLMMRHDENFDKVSEPLDTAAALLQEKKFAEAQTELDKTMDTWKQMSQKYPILLHDSLAPFRSELNVFVSLYAESLKGQEKPVPGDFPFKSLMP